MTFQTQQTVALEKILKALADRTRLRIVGLLLAGEVCVCHIHDSLGIPQPKTSRHLAYLRRAGLVAARKDGLWVHYRLAELPEPVLQAVLEAVAHAVGHLPLAARDRQRLAARVGLTSPVRVIPGGCCCTPQSTSPSIGNRQSPISTRQSPIRSSVGNPQSLVGSLSRGRSSRH